MTDSINVNETQGTEADLDQLQEEQNASSEAHLDDDLHKDGVSIITLKNDKYTWVYELPMLKSLFILGMVWKVLVIASLIVTLFMTIVGLVEGSGLKSVLFALELGGGILGILLVLSIPAYLIVTKANNGKYTVLFEMDDDGIDHTQIKTDMAKALDILTIGVGAMGGNRSAVNAGLLSATGSSLYSKFSKVRKVKAFPKKGLIKLNGLFVHNQIYVDPDDFQFVYDYIMERCKNAKEI